MNYTTAVVQFITPSGQTHDRVMCVENNGHFIVDKIEHELISEKYNGDNADFSFGDSVRICVNGIKTPWYKITNFGFAKV